MEILNKAASYNYFIEETYEAGIELKGTEVKSLREGSCNIKDAYCLIRNNEVIVINMYIAKYKQGNIFNHDELRNKKNKTKIRRKTLIINTFKSIFY